MAEVEAVSESDNHCRMCMEDLSTFTEYYLIDGELSELLESLTSISVDPDDASLPLNMCTNCFGVLNTFNITKMTWIENQAQFVLEEEVDIEEASREFPCEVLKEEILEEEQIEVDLAEPEYEYPVEYIDEMELNDAGINSGETNEDPDSDISVKEENLKVIKPSRKIKPKKSDQVVSKGKDIYQKLLKNCEECGKSIEKNRMEGHINKHKNIRPFICNIEGCGKTFYCKLLLRLHRTSIHTGQSIKCEVCSKIFPSDRSLYSHKLRHLNENKYHCTYCERKFNNSNSLKRHLDIHSGIRQFSCEHCTSKFYRKFNLDVHVRTVHQKTKTFTCDYCPKRFGYARLLREHIRKFHSNEQVSESWFKVEA